MCAFANKRDSLELEPCDVAETQPVCALFPLVSSRAGGSLVALTVFTSLAY